MPEQRIDIDERAHLRDVATPPIYRYLPATDLQDLVRRYWIPVWSLPPGQSTVQRVLLGTYGREVKRMLDCGTSLTDIARLTNRVES